MPARMAPTPSNNIHVNTTLKAEDSEKARTEEQQPLSPGLLSPPLYFKEDKDTMAYEHDRQKYKKALDRARNKARKAFGWGYSEANNGRHSGGRTRAAGAVRGGDEDSELALEYSPGSPDRRRSTGLGPEAQQQVMMYTGGTPFSEVRLADLVMLAASDENVVRGSANRKNRKGNVGKAGLDGDFEVVPHVRSVIVLDEQQFVVPDAEIGGPWECIEDESESDDSERKVEKATYAGVAAAAFKETK